MCNFVVGRCQRHEKQGESQADTVLLSSSGVSLARNPSSFGVYCSVRRSVLASVMRRRLSLSHRDVASAADSDDDSDIQNPSTDNAPRLPKVS